MNFLNQGEMEKFKNLVSSSAALVQRLKQTVTKFALKKINSSYSRIHLRDVMTKLNLESVEETEQIVAKAIRDGVIKAEISNDN